MNRQITGRIATYHFSPTALSKKNLLTEGVQEDKITVTGNTVIDALHIVVDKIKTDGALQQELAGVLEKAGYDTSRLADGKKLVLITGHPDILPVSSQIHRYNGRKSARIPGNCLPD